MIGSQEWNPNDAYTKSIRHEQDYKNRFHLLLLLLLFLLKFFFKDLIYLLRFEEKEEKV